jgi:(4-(4-[2-(gamma-L-glutamylamino)ethyl]phenoxymethyl)furan-2-yl)methanamine synthase
MTTHIIGWDIGGAHLKAAVIKPEQGVTAVYQQSCELWKGLDKLTAAVGHIFTRLPVGQQQHVITMTGELVDLFANRDEGVHCILATMQVELGDSETWVYAGIDGLINLTEVKRQHYATIASANWLATASYTARQCGNGILVDIGSTTTDVLLLENNQVKALGLSDYDRLISQELVYTGIVRTPVMAVAQFAQDHGRVVGLMAEYFATMADVYRVIGELDENHDQSTTADGGDKTILASAKRLSRMIGCDFYEHDLSRWQNFAQDLKNRQITQIENACEQQLKRCNNPSVQYPLIGAGVGRFLVQQLALKMARPYLDFSQILPSANSQTALNSADCAPAVAVAYLYLLTCFTF